MSARETFPMKKNNIKQHTMPIISKKTFLFILICATIQSSLCTQIKSDKPKLIVGIVVDQMRYDILHRLEHNFGDNGLKRLMYRGFSAENMQYNYVPTYTGPGHASIYTGSVPAIHGIAANDWIENKSNKRYCTQDEFVKAVGGDSKAGKMSPQNMKTTTITDQLKLFTNNQSKVIGIALKDRGAILPAGHMANAAYWYDGKTGNWMTSSFYTDKLPLWVDKFNAQHHPAKLMQQQWNLLLSKEKYTYHNHDNEPWEEANFGKSTPTFPYTFDTQKYNSDIRYTPYGNTLTTNFAVEALQAENLGRNVSTDFLAISYSSTDYVGHATGPYSLETEDTYYRLDSDIAQLLDALDRQMGKDNYWIFVTADHGVQDAIGYSQAHRIPAIGFSEDKIRTILNQYLQSKLHIANAIRDITNEQIYLESTLTISSTDIARTLNTISSDSVQGIAGFYSFESLGDYALPHILREKINNGYSRNRSGDIYILLEPNGMNQYRTGKGTTHGSPYTHDSHIPFLFYGKGVKAAHSSRPYHITDIAPTISYLLGMLHPNGCIGTPISELDYLK